MTINESTIKSRNEFNLVCNEIEGHLVRLLSDWQQKKAVKVSGHGGFVQKLKAQLDDYNASHGYNVQGGDLGLNIGGDLWLNVYTSYTSVLATVRNIKTGSKVEIYLARFDDATGVLTQIHECQKRRTDYTLEEVQSTFKKAKDLEQQARDLLSSVYDFR